MFVLKLLAAIVFIVFVNLSWFGAGLAIFDVIGWAKVGHCVLITLGSGVLYLVFAYVEWKRMTPLERDLVKAMNKLQRGR